MYNGVLCFKNRSAEPLLSTAWRHVLTSYTVETAGQVYRDSTTVNLYSKRTRKQSECTTNCDENAISENDVPLFFLFHGDLYRGVQTADNVSKECTMFFSLAQHDFWQDIGNKVGTQNS